MLTMRFLDFGKISRRCDLLFAENAFPIAAVDLFLRNNERTKIGPLG